MLEHAIHELRLELRDLRREQRQTKKTVARLEAWVARAQRIAWLAVYFGGTAALLLLNLKRDDLSDIIAAVLKKLLLGM